MKHLLTLFFLLSVFFTMCRCSLPFLNGTEEVLTILSYNVQNIFDAVDNGTEYHEYDPSEGDWDELLYHQRLLNLSEVIKASVKGGPDIIALQEVENLHVVEDLVSQYLKGMGYEDLCVTAKEDSAVQIGFISRIPFDSVIIHDLFTEDYKSIRPALEVKLVLGTESLYIFNNHWKSRLGGALNTEEQRIMSAQIIRNRMDSIVKSEKDAKIVVLGDFNENHDEYIRAGKTYTTALYPDTEYTGTECPESVLLVTGNKNMKVSGALYEPWFQYRAEAEEGSYYFNGSWETLDHCLIGNNLWSESGVHYSSFGVVTLPFILSREGTPLFWNKVKGTGYSDHLPLLLTLCKD